MSVHERKFRILSLSVDDMDLSFAHGENQFSITHFLCAAAAVLMSSAAAAVACAFPFEASGITLPTHASLYIFMPCAAALSAIDNSHAASTIVIFRYCINLMNALPSYALTSARGNALQSSQKLF